MTAKMPVRLKGQITCEHHKGRELDIYCETCHEPVCPKCVTSLHKGHLFCDLSEIIPLKEEKIRNFIDNTEKNVLQDIGNYIASANTLLTENDRTFEQLSKDLKAQNERLKQELDMLTAETLSVYQKKRNDNTKLIQKYKQDLDLYDKQLKQKIEECQNVLRQGSHIEIYDFTDCEIDPQLHLPVKPVLGIVSFTPNKSPRNHLKLALGTSQSDGSGQSTTLAVKDRSVSLLHGQEQSSTHQNSGGMRKEKVTRTKLLTVTRVVEEWASPCDILSICPTTDDQAWTCDYNKTLTLLDRTGTVIQEVTHKGGINDISLSPTTHRLWACDKQSNILELISGQLSLTFRTKDEPICICVTSDNHIIIGMSKLITKYTTQGQMVLTTDATGTVTPLVCSPWRVTECPITKNIAVVDHDYVDDGGDGNEHVVVMDSDLQELFICRGDVPSRYKETSQTGDVSFNPQCVAYDRGDIIIADWANDNILLLSGDGELLKIIDTEISGVWAVGVSEKGVVWIANMCSNDTTSKQRNTKELM
ncbi:uncharacterized protein [Argopecten irradians]|uniref:uncharacterized protein n=1 Tax=Argopecten irradians TaxID=31199 RepID=UPI003723760F